MRVLVIDDEDLVRETVRAILTAAGHEVSVATDGVHGLEVLKTQPFDLVISDILMPEKEGIQTILEVRETCPFIKIIGMSGGGRTKNFDPLRIAGKAGAHRTLAKPFLPEDLLNTVQEVADL